MLECEFVAGGNAFQLDEAESTRAAVKLPEQAARVLRWDARHLATRFVPTWVAKKSGTARSAGSKKTAEKIRYRYRPTR